MESALIGSGGYIPIVYPTHQITKYRDKMRRVWLRSREILARSKTVSINYSENLENLPYCFFLHIPRCGGTSIEHALKRVYPRTAGLQAAASFKAVQALYPEKSLRERDFHMFKLRENLLLYNMGCHTPLVYGHYGFSESAYREFGAEYRFITLLRNPVERFISLYYYNFFKSQKYAKTNMDINTFIHSEEGRSQGCQYVKFIGGVVKDGQYRSAEARKRALSNLEKFFLVGILEHLDDFILTIQALLKQRICVLHENKNPKPRIERKKTVSEDLLKKIHFLCGPDIEIYNHALTLSNKTFPRLIREQEGI